MSLRDQRVRGSRGRFERHARSAMRRLETDHARVARTNEELRQKTNQLSQTLRKLAEANKRLEERSEELTVSNQQLQVFAAAASHDMKTPLRHIAAFSKLLLNSEAEQLSEKGRRQLSHVHSSALRMISIIESLLDYARVDSVPLQLTRVDLTRVAREVAADLEEETATANATIEIGTLPEVHADESQMYQVLANLLSNAIKYRRPDVPPKVRLLGRRASDAPAPRDPKEPVERITRWQIMVHDNGIGFHESQAERIFAPFKRLVQTEDYEGAGIGLSTVKRIVERHGGSIGVRSQPGVGSTFVVTLPERPPARPSTPAARPSVLPPAIVRHLLIVDDDPLELEAAEERLKNDYRVSTATTATEAMEMLAREAVDVLLVDLDMPDVDGLGLLSAVRRSYPEIRRLLTSGTRPRAVDAHRRTGLVEAFLPKPVAVSDVSGLLEPDREN